MTERERAAALLQDLPLSQRQRALYLAGLAKMSDEQVSQTLTELESALESAPQALAVAEELLARYRHADDRG